MKLYQILLFIACTTLCAQSPTQQLDLFVQQALSDFGVPGASVAVVQDGKVVLVKGYGVGQVDQATPVDPETIFQLASVTKTFTAASLGQLVEKGKTGWDEPVIDHLPQCILWGEYPTRWVTARDLLAHRSGLPAFKGDLLGHLGYSESEILRRVRSIEPTFSFREKAAYSNVGYFILGQLAKAMSGTEWRDLVRQGILQPLEMNRTGFAEQLSDPNAAKGYALVDGRLEEVVSDKSEKFLPAGGMTSTATDMAKYMIALLSGGGKILTRGTVAEIFLPSMVAQVDFSEQPPIEATSGFSYGMGWGNYHYNGHMVVEKGGALPGVRTVVTLVPDRQIGIAVLTNLNLTLMPEAVRAKFLELYLGESSSDLQAEILSNQPTLSALTALPSWPDQPVPLAGSASDYAGTFVSDLYGLFVIEPNGSGELSLKAGPAQYPGLLSHYSSETFVLTWSHHATAGWQFITFTLAPDGKASGFQTETLGEFKREEGETPSS